MKAIALPRITIVHAACATDSVVHLDALRDDVKTSAFRPRSPIGLSAS